MHRSWPRLLSSIVVWSIVVVSSGAAAAQVPAPEIIKDIDLDGDWQNRRTYSGIARQGSLIIVGGDEGQSLHVGSMQGFDFLDPDGYDFLSRVTLPLLAGDGAYDIEAVTSGGGEIYAIGSHAATRKAVAPVRPQADNRVRLETVETNVRRQYVFRFGLDGKGFAYSMSHRSAISGYVSSEAVLGPFWALPRGENGIEIEGLAYHDGFLYAGLRGPVVRDGLVPVVRFTFDGIGDKSLLFVALDGRGIRDLVRVSDGFLLLVGPVDDRVETHDVYWWDGTDCVPGNDVPPCAVTRLGALSRSTGGRAEGMFVASETADAYEVVVAFEGAPAGREVTQFRVFRTP